MTPTPNDLITDLDALTHELRRVAVGMAEYRQAIAEAKHGVLRD